MQKASVRCVKAGFKSVQSKNTCHTVNRNVPLAKKVHGCILGATTFSKGLYNALSLVSAEICGGMVPVSLV